VEQFLRYHADNDTFGGWWPRHRSIRSFSLAVGSLISVAVQIQLFRRCYARTCPR